MHSKLPRIILTQRDHECLFALASAVVDRIPDVGEFLMREVSRAKVVGPERIRPGVVTMGSRVTFRYDQDDKRQTVTLVYPGLEDISVSRISILSMVGAALIGLSEGQSISFITPGGKERSLAVLKVRYQPKSRSRFEA